MTKKLTKEQKKANLEARRARTSNQQKAPSPTVKTIEQPKPAEDPPATAFDAAMAALDEAGQAILKARWDSILEEAAKEDLAEFDGGSTLEEKAAILVRIVQDIRLKETKPKAPKAKKDGPTLMRKPDPARFLKEEDFGECPTCHRALKRTSYSMYIDAVRCTNPRCRNYRNIVNTISSNR